MAQRERSRDRGVRRSREALVDLGRQVRIARIGADISQGSVAESAGIDQSWVSRFERGQAPGISMEAVSVMLAAVGLDLSVRAYPGGDPVRDRPQLDLLRRLRSEVSEVIRWSSEVPLPTVGDPRAWDALLGIGQARWGVEAETRIGDVQARVRSLQLKRRDGRVDGVILLLRDSRHHRLLAGQHRSLLEVNFPVQTDAALSALRAGRPPAGDAIILL